MDDASFEITHLWLKNTKFAPSFESMDSIFQYNEIKNLLDREKGNGIVITTHHKPDADALGSSLALCHLLKNQGHQVTVITPTDYPFFLTWMTGEESVINFEERPSDAAFLVEQAAIIFCLDFNDLSRINELGGKVAASKATIVNIDHHRDPKPFADLKYCTLETSSTCELIYRLADDFHWMEDGLNKDIASCIYVGIMTDTGSFRFNSTSALTHRITAHLLEKGANGSLIHELINDNFSLNRYRMMGYILYEKLEIIPQYRTALVYLTREELKKFEVQTGDTEGFVNYGLGIKGIVLSVLIIDRTKIVKMSFRSKGNFPCNQMASAHFDGGGHLNASGGSSQSTLEETVEKFRSILPQYQKQLLEQP